MFPGRQGGTETIGTVGVVNDSDGHGLGSVVRRDFIKQAACLLGRGGWHLLAQGIKFPGQEIDLLLLAKYGAIQFVDQIFGIATKTLLAKIHQEVFKGEMTKPSQASSDEEVVQHVAASPGTIGVVSPQGASHLPSSVVIVRVGG